jgi:pimeloyl-ACP methyl ester carboxylesterase
MRLSLGVRLMPEGNLQFQGLNIFYREAGSGPPVILLHCAGGTSGQWRKLMERMSDRYRLIAIDLFGHGKSDAAPEAASDIFELEVEMLAAFVAMAGGKAHLVGHSSGGSAAARYAVSHGGAVKSLAMYEPVLFSLLANGGDEEGWADYLRLFTGMRDRLAANDREGAAEVMVDYWTSPGSWKKLPQDRQAQTIAGIDVAQAKTKQYVDDPTAGIINPNEICAPTLLLSGADSPRSAHGVIDILFNNITSADMHRLDGAGHMGPLSHADAVNSLIEKHIERYQS